MPKAQSIQEIEARLAGDVEKTQKRRACLKRTTVVRALEEEYYRDALYDHFQLLKRQRTGDLKDAMPKKKTVTMSDEWLEQYTRPCNTPSRLLKRVLQAVDRVCFSEGNLSLIMGHGKREPTPLVLSQFLEYATDIRHDEIIPKCLRSIQCMMDRAKNQVQAKRLLNLLVSEVNFGINGSHGIYMIKDVRASKGLVAVALRFANPWVWKKVPKTFTGDIELVSMFPSQQHLYVRKMVVHHICCICHS